MASLYLKALLLFLISLANAGEIVLYRETKCQTPGADVFFVLSSDKSTGCISASTLPNPAYSISTLRNVGSSCTFEFFSEEKCADLAHKIVSSGPEQNCLEIPNAAQSYQITCQAAEPNKHPALPKGFPDALTHGGWDYFQPQTTYRGKAAGHTWWYLYLPIRGNIKTTKPGGNPSVVGQQLATKLLNNVPAASHTYQVEVNLGGTSWTLHAGGDENYDYTINKMLTKTGPASFASMMADVVAAMAKNPTQYLYFSVGNHDDPVQMGYVNVTYT